jgi:hypothetical protein
MLISLAILSAGAILSYPIGAAVIRRYGLWGVSVWGLVIAVWAAFAVACYGGGFHPWYFVYILALSPLAWATFMIWVLLSTLLRRRRSR